MNKVNTKVDMRLNVTLSGWISEDLKDALQRLVSWTARHAGSRVSACRKASVMQPKMRQKLVRAPQDDAAGKAVEHVQKVHKSVKQHPMSSSTAQAACGRLSIAHACRRRSASIRRGSW